MIGKIVEIDELEGLFVVVDFKNNERPGDCTYDREFWLHPYESSFSDDMTFSLKDAIMYYLTGTQYTVRVRDDKKEFTPYGHSIIRGQKFVMLERIWEEIIVPSR